MLSSLENINQGRTLLICAGVISSLFAALHIIVIFIGAPAYRYFGAGEEMAILDQNGSLIPALVTLAVAFILTIFAVYAFSGASLIRKIPFLRTGLLIITAIYLLRGIGVVADAAMLVQHSNYPIRALIFSLTSLLTGLLYLLGLKMCWNNLRTSVSDESK
ncbi:hypothetical protein F9K33_16345 [bacterium]|nr:MAG: hypothetical protein F9K33_16345 [bacterium]